MSNTLDFGPAELGVMRARGAQWPDQVDEIVRGDLTAAAAYLTAAGGVVVTGVAPCGLVNRAEGTVGYTTSLGFSKKLEHMLRDPHTALAYHTREHGFATGKQFVLVTGSASVDLTPSRERIDAMMPAVERYLGEVKRGPLWDRILHAYYYERVFVDIRAERIVVWPDLAAAGSPEVYGSPTPPPPDPQPPPAHGTGPRVDVDRVVGQVSSLPHRVVAYRGSDGYPVVVPVDFAGHDASGIRLIAAPGLLPPGGRRAGFLAHSYRPQLVGIATRGLTGWLEVTDDGTARYAPHTSVGFTAPPNKSLLLLANGVMATVGMRRARRHGTVDRLERLAHGRAA